MATAILLGILLFALASFAREWLPIELTALAALGLLLAFDLVTPAEAVSGLSHPAVVTVMMMFVLSEALARTGMVARLGHRIAHQAGASSRRATLLLLLATGGVSAFINNTAAVSILIPVALQLSKHYRQAPSRILLPLSYLAMFGGTCTLIGTSTNLLVSGMAGERGIRTIGMFEMLPLGLVLVVVGTVYLIAFGPARLPHHPAPDDLTHKYHLGGFLTELRIPAGSPLHGRTVMSEQVSERFRLTVLEILRGKQKIAVDIRFTELRPGDILILRGAPADLVHFRDHYGLLMLTDTKLSDADLADERAILAEVQLSPVSSLLGRTIKEIDFRRRFGVFVLALNRTGETVREKLAFIPLKAWDTLLVFGPRQRVEGLGGQEDFVPLQEHDLALRPHSRSWVAITVAVAVVITAALGWVSILEAALIGAIGILVAGVIPIQQAYKAIDWSVIFLIAALIPLGHAMERTGLADLVGQGVLTLGGPLGPIGVLAIVYLATSLLTEIVSNNAAAILMVPIAITAAGTVGADPRPFLMAVAFAGSSSLLTPMGYQTNAMVYGPGGYRFADYPRLGWPLKIVFWGITVAAIPLLWPL